MKPLLQLSLVLVGALSLGFTAAPAALAAALEFKLAQRSQPVLTPPPKPSSVVALDFRPKAPAGSPLETPADYSPNELFAGASNSLVAKAVGSAEGTRTPSGGYTSAYYGHVDPGNGVWNLGSFSYQHGASSPEQADRKQLGRLQRQALELRQQAQAKSFSLSLLEELNGIDLANQAPLAALDRGYISWLHVAKQRGLSEQIIWARTKAFLDPDTGIWDAPGLGNNWDAIYYDQRRRYRAIERALVQH